MSEQFACLRSSLSHTRVYLGPLRSPDRNRAKWRRCCRTNPKADSIAGRVDDRTLEWRSDCVSSISMSHRPLAKIRRRRKLLVTVTSAYRTRKNRRRDLRCWRTDRVRSNDVNTMLIRSYQRDSCTDCEDAKQSKTFRIPYSCLV